MCKRNWTVKLYNKEAIQKSDIIILAANRVVIHVIAAAALATLEEITTTNLIQEALEKEALIKKQLQHPLIKDIRGKGLMLAIMVDSSEIANKIVLQAKEDGLILFWLLYEPKAVRISPPLTISKEEIVKGCKIILNILNSI